MLSENNSAIDYLSEFSTNATIWIASGSIVVAIMSLMATVVAMLVAARSVLAAQKYNKEAKQIEMQRDRNKDVQHLLEAVVGGEPSMVNGKEGRYQSTAIQIIAAARLSEYPEFQNHIKAAFMRIDKIAVERPSSEWSTIRDELERTLLSFRSK
ncbi:hypothetical protein [Roseibium sp.]|uniref:hypothetical protein n=1 Tax=Roseibium sp. TaxID=1936156 RepID=UPI003B516EAD